MGVAFMKRLDLEPTEANICACLDKDITSRNADIKRFISLLDEIEPPFSLCIDAPWGDGKTMFVKSVHMILEARNPNVDSDGGRNALSWAVDESAMKTETSGFLPVYFNAWMNDMLDNRSALWLRRWQQIAKLIVMCLIVECCRRRQLS